MVFLFSWEGEGVDEIGRDKRSGKVRVKVNSRYFRPTEVDLLLGDPSKAKEKLNWVPKVTFRQLVKEMVEADISLMKAKPTA